MDLSPTMLARLRALESVARLGSFHAAAAELYVSPSAVSHHVRHLERSLETALLRRDRRGVTATAEAAELVDSTRRAFDTLNTALARYRARDAGNTVILTVAPYFSAHWLTPRLVDLWRRHPQIDLRLHHAYAPVDFDTDAADLGIVWGDGQWPDVSATKILDGSLIAVCNRRVAEQLGTPFDRAELLRHPLLYEFHQEHWLQWLAHFDITPAAHTRLTRIDDSHALRAAALDGHGVALFARSLLDEELAQGTLIQLGSAAVGTDHYYLTVPTRRVVGPAVRTVMEWIGEHVGRS
jgi:DNA-binding transcriptional LysR family regulator